MKVRIIGVRKLLIVGLIWGLISIGFVPSLRSDSQVDYFKDFEEVSNQVEERGTNDLQILEDFNFRPFSENLPSEHKVYSYDAFFAGVRPDIGVRIGRKTVDKWSRRFLSEEQSPVRHIRYEIVQDYLDVIVTVDFDFFSKELSMDVISPAWAPGETFNNMNSRKPFESSKHAGESFVFDLRFRLRFPLIGYQNAEKSGSLNTVHMEFTKQAIQTYYLSDFNTFLDLSAERIRQLDRKSDVRSKQSFGGDSSPSEKLKKASDALDRLMHKFSQTGSLTAQEQARLKEIQNFLNSEDSLESLNESMSDLVKRIENFKASSLLPVVPSAAAVKYLIQLVTKQGVLANYLDMEVITYNDQAGGILKVSGLNRVIEANLPLVDVYFVGIDQRKHTTSKYFGEEPSKLFLAARMR